MKEIDFLALITDKVNKANIEGDSAIIYIKETVKTGGEVVTMKLEFYRKDGGFRCVSINYKYHPHLGEVYQRSGYNCKDLLDEEEELYLNRFNIESKIGRSCLGGYLDTYDLLRVAGLVIKDTDSLPMVNILTNCAAIELQQAEKGEKLTDDEVLSKSFDGIFHNPLRMSVVKGDKTPHYIANRIEETNFGAKTYIHLDERQMWFPVDGTFAYNIAMKWMGELVYPYAKYKLALLERSFDPDVVVTKDGERVVTWYGYTVPVEDGLDHYVKLNERHEFMALEDVVTKIYSVCAESGLHVKNVRLFVPDEDDIDLYRSITYELE
jgi:hypothetical protein|nr:MAG TPA: hypothetical protein [Caudoviricetes sp.]